MEQYHIWGDKTRAACLKFVRLCINPPNLEMSIKLRIINVSYSYKAFDFQESFSQLSNGTLLGVALVENSYGLISTKCMDGCYTIHK